MSKENIENLGEKILVSTGILTPGTRPGLLDWALGEEDVRKMVYEGHNIDKKSEQYQQLCKTAEIEFNAKFTPEEQKAKLTGIEKDYQAIMKGAEAKDQVQWPEVFTNALLLTGSLIGAVSQIKSQPDTNQITGSTYDSIQQAYDNAVNWANDNLAHVPASLTAFAATTLATRSPALGAAAMTFATLPTSQATRSEAERLNQVNGFIHDTTVNTRDLEKTQRMLEKGLINPNAPLDDQGITLLQMAAHNGNRQYLELLIKHGANVDQPNIYGMTPAIYATVGNQPDCLKVLAENGADLHSPAEGERPKIPDWATSDDLFDGTYQRPRDWNGDTPERLAAEYKHLDILDVLGEYGVNLHTAAQHAAFTGSLSTFRVLEKHNTDYNQNRGHGEDPLFIASLNEKQHIVEFIQDSNSRKLIDAIAAQDYDQIYYLSNRGRILSGFTGFGIGENGAFEEIVTDDFVNNFNPYFENEQGETLLTAAANTGNISLVQDLITQHCDPNQKNQRQWTLLHHVENLGYDDMFAELLTMPEVDRNIDYNGWPTLVTASIHGRESMVDALLQYPDVILDTTIPGNDETALSVAAEKGHHTIVSSLINAGLDPNHANAQGWTPLNSAIDGLHDDTVSMLIANPQVNIDQPTEGFSPLMFLTFKGMTDHVPAILERGPDLDFQAPNGKTALEMAEEFGQTEIAAMIKQHKQTLEVETGLDGTAAGPSPQPTSASQLKQPYRQR